MAIKYQISPNQVNEHLFDVSIIFTAKHSSEKLSLPAWLPGSYMIRDFAKNVVNFKAINEGKPVEIELIDKQTWQLNNVTGEVKVSYQVYAFDLSVRTAYLDQERGFFNGSSTFICVESQQDSPCELEITAPIHASNWRVATGMRRAKSTECFTFGQYVADDYAELIDCPVAIGDFSHIDFQVEGVTHHLVFTSKHYGDMQRMATDIAKLCQHHISLFGEAPFKEYWFITHLLESGFGGLEHKNSTILQASRFDLPNPQKPQELTDDYKTFLSLCSHEYFHAWNVCRIKPKAFVPYDLSAPSYTTQLWAYEGITSYYDDFSLYRAGIISFEDYLTILAKTATRVFRGEGELKQSVTESSFYAWTKFYQQGPDALNHIVSYYTKGSLIALWLDLTIREKSNGQYSLDQLMRELWIHFGRPQQGTSEEDFINIANILCGEDISEAFNDILHSAKRLPVADILKRFGTDFTAAKFEKLNDLATKSTQDYHAFLGAHFKAQPLGLKITQVVEQSPAAKAGLAVDDILVAVDNLKMTEKNIAALANHLPEGQKVNCHFFRDDQLLQSELAFIDSPLSGITIKEFDQSLSAKWRNII